MLSLLYKPSRRKRLLLRLDARLPHHVHDPYVAALHGKVFLLVDIQPSIITLLVVAAV